MTATIKATSDRTALRIAMVGAGMISHHHLIAWSREPRAKVVAICDPDLERAKKRAVEFGISATYHGLSSLLAAQEVDALDIASPRETHATLVDMAAERSIDVLCQKPLAPTLAEAEALARRVEGRIRLMVHENWRFRPWYRALKRKVDDRAFGDLRWAGMATISSGLLPDASGERPALERQPFMAHEKRLAIAEVLIHYIDVMRWILGPFKMLLAR